MAWMLSNLYRSCHNNELDKGVGISSVCYNTNTTTRKHTTCHITALYRVIMTSFIHFCSSSNATSKRKFLKTQLMSASRGWTKMRTRRWNRHISACLPVCKMLDQLSSWASCRGFVSILFSQKKKGGNNVLYSITP